MSTRATWALIAESRFEAYLGALSATLGHAGRAAPMRAYCRGLLLPGERKNIELVAARLGSNRVRALHQSMHHVVAKAGWDDAAVLAEVRRQVLPALDRSGAVRYFTVNNVALPKQGIHSVGVARQSSGSSAGEAVNCQVAVSLWASNERASLPIAYRLFLPPEWVENLQRRDAAGVPPDIGFESKTTIALRQLRQACADGVSASIVLGGAGYGDEAEFRTGLRALGLRYMLDVSPETEFWPPEAAEPPVARPCGRPGRGSRRPISNQGPTSAQALAAALPIQAWRTITMRDRGRVGLSPRFAAVRVGLRPTDFDDMPNQDKWLLAEWPAGKAAPVRFWLSDLSTDATLKSLAWTARSVCRIVTEIQNLKQNIGLAHFEGRGWRGHHHHASLCIAAYGFLVSERCQFPLAQRYIPYQAEAPEQLLGRWLRGPK